MSRPTHKPNLAEAQSIVCAGIRPVGGEWAGAPELLHRVIRRDVPARRAYPSADCAARDGYGLPAVATRRASAVQPAVLRLRATIRPGERPAASIGPEECVRIMTGGLLPDGADAVVPLEEAQAERKFVSFSGSVKPGTHVRRAGAVARAGDLIARTGDLVTPGLLGLLLATGVTRARVSRRVRVGILSTGNEVITGGVSPRPWQIHDSNAHMLAGLVCELGGETVGLGIAGDTRDDIESGLRAGKACDVVLITGGSSTGISDLVPGALERYGCRTLIRGIALRPGKHMVFARKGPTAYFGLPGRPGGCFSLFHMLVRPAIMATMGRSRPIPAPLRAFWDGRRTQRPPVDTLSAACLGPGSRVRPAGGIGASDLGSLARSNSLVLIRGGVGALRKGDTLDAFPFELP